jgi:hypothetical protein
MEKVVDGRADVQVAGVGKRLATGMVEVGWIVAAHGTAGKRHA